MTSVNTNPQQSRYPTQVSAKMDANSRQAPPDQQQVQADYGFNATPEKEARRKAAVEKDRQEHMDAAKAQRQASPFASVPVASSSAQDKTPI